MAQKLTQQQIEEYFGLTPEYIEEQARQLEDENVDDGLTGEVIWGAPWEQETALKSRTVRLGEAQDAKLVELAKKENTTVSAILRRAITTYLLAMS